jgi:hypothetical protein
VKRSSGAGIETYIDNYKFFSITTDNEIITFLKNNYEDYWNSVYGNN